MKKQIKAKSVYEQISELSDRVERAYWANYDERLRHFYSKVFLPSKKPKQIKK